LNNYGTNIKKRSNIDCGNDEDNDIEITENGVVNEKKRMIDQDEKDNEEKELWRWLQY